MDAISVQRRKRGFLFAGIEFFSAAARNPQTSAVGGKCRANKQLMLI